MKTELKEKYNSKYFEVLPVYWIFGTFKVPTIFKWNFSLNLVHLLQKVSYISLGTMLNDEVLSASFFLGLLFYFYIEKRCLIYVGSRFVRRNTSLSLDSISYILKIYLSSTFYWIHRVTKKNHFLSRFWISCIYSKANIVCTVGSFLQI